MILPVLFLLFAPPAEEAKTPTLTDTQRLAISQAQVEVLSLQQARIDVIAKVNADIDAKLKEAHAKLQAALKVAQDVCKGEVTEKLECAKPAPKPSAPKPTPEKK
jgi:hypothetical protein